MSGNRPWPIPTCFGKDTSKSYTWNSYNQGISLKGKRAGLRWWAWMLILGLGLLLVFTLTPSFLSSHGASSSLSQPPAPPGPIPETGTGSGIGTAGTGSPQPRINGEGGETVLAGGSGGENEQVASDWSSTEEGGFLGGYDPSDTPFLGADSNSRPALGGDERPSWLVGVELGAKLLLVLGLVYVVMAGLRRLLGNKYKSTAGNATINVLETTGLGPGRTLHLVVVGEKTLLIGATDHQLSLLAELSDTAIPLPDETETLTNEQFSQALHLHSHQPPAAVSNWQAALAGLRAGVQRIRESGGE